MSDARTTSAKDRAGADESTRAAGKWLRETGLAELVPNPPTITSNNASSPMLDAAQTGMTGWNAPRATAVSRSSMRVAVSSSSPPR